MTLISSFLFYSLSFNAISGEKKSSYKVIPKDQFAGQKEKNGIALEEILKNFNQDFTFVSSHFREDKFEIRLIYANKLGMEGLKSKDHKYKDGSIFYKVVYFSEHDPNFEASLIPGSQPTARQFMVHDSKKYKKFNGWGYAVFTGKGDTLPGDPDSTLSTCYACHQLVENQNNIFSYPMETITPNNSIPNNQRPKMELSKSKELSEKLFRFKIVDFSSLDPDIKIILNQRAAKVNVLDGEILKMNFSGFMSELSSFLIKETRKNNMPSLAIKNFNNVPVFSYSFIDVEANQCKKNERLIRFGWGKLASTQEKSSYHSLKKCFPL